MGCIFLRLALLWQSSPRNSFRMARRHGHSRSVVLGTLAGYWYLRKHNIDFWAFADIFAPALILAQSVGRMANLFNGDAFGHPTGGNFGILYPESTLHTAPMVISHYGQLKFGKAKSIF